MKLQFIPAFVRTDGRVCAHFTPVPAETYDDACKAPVMQQHGLNGTIRIIGICVHPDLSRYDAKKEETEGR